ncbi:MAG: hypothetical protein WCJ70_05190 [bacterium]
MNPPASSNSINIPAIGGATPLPRGVTVAAGSMQPSNHIEFSPAGYGHMIWGYLLLFTGVMIIFVASLQAYGLYRGTVQLPKIFNFPGIKLDLAAMQPKMDTSAIAEMAKRAGVEAPKMPELPAMEPTEIVSAEMVNESSNLGAFIFLLGFAVNVGYKVSSLGVKLIRPLYVKV